MSTFDEEMKEMQKGYRFFILVSEDNSSRVDYVIALRKYNDEIFIKIEYLIRVITDSARILAVINGKLVHMRRSKFYYGGSLLKQKDFIQKVDYAILDSEITGPPHNHTDREYLRSFIELLKTNKK